AALGTWLFALMFISSAIVPWLNDDYWRLASRFNSLLYVVVLASYYLAFNTPRALRMAWQQREQAKYLSQSAALDPETRGQRTAQDLSTTASRAVGNALAVV